MLLDWLTIRAYKNVMERIDPAAEFERGNSALAEGRAGDAVRHCRRALRVALDVAEVLHNLAAAWSGLAGVAMAQGVYEEASGNYQESLPLSPKNPVAMDNLAICEQRLVHAHEALALYRDLAVLNPKLTRSETIWVRCYKAWAGMTRRWRLFAAPWSWHNSWMTGLTMSRRS